MQVVLSVEEVKLIKKHGKVWGYLLEEIERTGNKLIDTTFDKIAKQGGYANRSGAWKYIKKLADAGVVEVTERGKLLVNLPVIV